MKGKLQGSRQPFQGQGIASLDHLAGAPRAAVAGQNGPRKSREKCEIHRVYVYIYIYIYTCMHVYDIHMHIYIYI